MNKLKEKLKDLIWCLILLSPYIIAGIVIVLWIIALVKYGGKPINEIPAWALPFFIGR